MSNDSDNKNIPTSPDRHTFQQKAYIERCELEEVEPNEAYLELFETFRQRDENNMTDPEWQKDNLEYDLRSADWIVAKVRASDTYAQNLYAAMCNMQFQKLAVIPILKDQHWSCSWRHSGGIVADMRGEGDYIDWYCSGIRGGDEPDVYLDGPDACDGYVPEGIVTDEIRADLRNLGWAPVPCKDNGHNLA